MSLGFSLVLIALGAILAFAVDYSISGLSIQVVGVILMVVGFIGLALSMLFWASWAPYRREHRDDSPPSGTVSAGGTSAQGRE